MPLSSAPESPPETLDLWSSVETSAAPGPLSPMTDDAARLLPVPPGQLADVDRTPAPTLPRMRRTYPRGTLLCPASAEHGPLILTASERLYCPHHEHDLRTPCYFTLDAAEAARSAREEATR